MLCYVLNTQIRQKQSSVAHFTIVANDGLLWLSIVSSPQLICDVTRKQGIGIVTSYSSIVIARAKVALHLWITIVKIDFMPSRIPGLVWKK